MRKPVVAGTFYPGDREELKKMIRWCEEHELGAKRGGLNAKYGIAPHAGYMYSGPCATHTYKNLKKSELYVILGTNHTGYGRGYGASGEDWETPLGVVETDKELAEMIGIDEEAHRYEHSIEVQLPFLQYYFEDFKILPISVRDVDPKELAKELMKLLKGRDFSVIASSDFTHYGPAYGFFGPRDLDKLALKAIEEANVKKFLEVAEQTTICGYLPIATLLYMVKREGLRGKVLKYYTSADIIKSVNFVGYGSVVFV